MPLITRPQKDTGTSVHFRRWKLQVVLLIAWCLPFNWHKPPPLSSATSWAVVTIPQASFLHLRTSFRWLYVLIMHPVSSLFHLLFCPGIILQKHMTQLAQFG